MINKYQKNWSSLQTKNHLLCKASQLRDDILAGFGLVAMMIILIAITILIQ